MKRKKLEAIIQALDIVYLVRSVETVAPGEVLIRVLAWNHTMRATWEPIHGDVSRAAIEGEILDAICEHLPVGIIFRIQVDA